MRILSGLFGFVVILLALAFALANRQPAVINLWPFGVGIPTLFGPFVLAAFFFGLLLGALIAWFGLLPQRLKAWRLRKDLAALQDKVADLQKTVIPPVVAGGLSMLAEPKPKRRFWGSRS